jgi:hypothetical protein
MGWRNVYSLLLMFSSMGTQNVLLLHSQTAVSVYVPLAHAVSGRSAPRGLLSTTAAGVFVSAPTSRLRVSASTPDVPRSASRPSLLLSTADGQGPITEQILSVFLDCLHEGQNILPLDLRF